MNIHLDDTHRINVKINGKLVEYTPEFKVNVGDNHKWFVHGDTYFYPFPVDVVFTTHILFDCCLRNPKFISDVLFKALVVPAIIEREEKQNGQ